MTTSNIWDGVTVPMDSPRNVRDELLSAAVGLLDDHGPEALQTRSVAAAAATSTMTLYTQFGGMPGLIAEVAAEGRRRFDEAVTVPESDDPVADMLACGAAYRQFAIDHSHLYRLMFGSTSAHGIDPPAGDLLTMSPADIRGEYAAFGQLLNYVHRCIRAGRITAVSADDDRAVVATASQLWCMIHGFVMLELAGYFGDDGAGTISVLGAMVGNHLVAMGDSPERLTGSLGASGWL
jgi:AcrR family transcriptional regulator